MMRKISLPRANETFRIHIGNQARMAFAGESLELAELDSRIDAREAAMPSCEVCGRILSIREMKLDVMGNLMEMIWQGTPAAESSRFAGSVMERLAMKCNRCGTWICGDCAHERSTSRNAGRIQHGDCGGMYESRR